MHPAELVKRRVDRGVRRFRCVLRVVLRLLELELVEEVVWLEARWRAVNGEPRESRRIRLREVERQQRLRVTVVGFDGERSVRLRDDGHTVSGRGTLAICWVPAD